MHDRRESLLLNDRADWREAFSDPTIELAEGKLRLRRQPGSLRPIVDAGGSFGGLTEPTGLAVDAKGRVFILDSANATIKRFDPCAGAFAVLPCVGGKGANPRQFNAPRGIAISPSGDLVVADTGNKRLQIFLLDSLALRRIVTAPPPYKSWEPWDVAVTLDCRLYVSDRENGVIHFYDAHSIHRAAFGTFVKPTAIAVDRECNIYVIEEGVPHVTVIDAKGAFVRKITVADEAKNAFCPTSIAVDPDGNVCIADRVQRAVYVASCGCGQARRMRAATGEPSGLAFDASGNPIVAEADRKRVCTLEAKAVFETEGVFVTEALDSRIQQCQWHRVAIARSLPAGAQVLVETFTSEAPKSNEEILALPDWRWATKQYDALVSPDNSIVEWDCLVLSPPGRYLWLRLTLIGNGAVTPELAKIRVHFPRASSMQYLPAVYGEDPASRDFLARFLSIFDTMREAISDRLRGVSRYFDPEATDAVPARRGATDFLSWLASWIGLALENNWAIAKRRMLVRIAHELYERRGTPEGLRRAVRLFAEREPLILEHFKIRRWLFLNRGRLGDCSALFGASIVRRLQLDRFSRIGEFQLIDTGDPLRDPFLVHAHRFTVVVPLRRGADADAERRVLHEIIERSKPAHTLAELQLTDPRLRIGMQSFVGIDTFIAEYPSGVHAGKGSLGRDTVLSPPADDEKPPAMRAGIRTRIGASTTLR